jgi:hypothetical protein
MATIEYMPARLTPKETEELRQAVACLEGASFAQRLTDAVGRPVGMLNRAMPPSARRVIAHVSETALRGALKLALRTLDLNASVKPANRAHRLAAAASGAVGGALGLVALPFELPISTTILLRSIAEIAREEGEDLSAPEAAFACVEVFALGGQGGGESAFESGYFTGIVVSEKLAAQAAPILGAIGGAAVNAAFADHFQTLARGHFIVRRLERQHGASVVAFEYQRLQGERVREHAEGRRAAS